jgi:hypothetical protein
MRPVVVAGTGRDRGRTDRAAARNADRDGLPRRARARPKAGACHYAGAGSVGLSALVHRSRRLQVLGDQGPAASGVLPGPTTEPHLVAPMRRGFFMTAASARRTFSCRALSSLSCASMVADMVAKDSMRS